MKRICAAGLMAVLFACSIAEAKLVWHWEDRFTSEEKTKLTAWIETVVAGVEELVAPYPFDVHIHFYRTTRGSPVPWANTIRSRRQGVNFHVDANASEAALRADWTAPHELSHLLIPYLGRQNSWFAEGFASYMQYQVMHSLGDLTDEQMRARYQERIDRAERRYDMNEMPFAEAAPKLRARRQYPTMYWGGAVYFLRVDRELRERDQSIPEVIRSFVECCRSKRYDLKGLAAELDRLSDGTSFTDQLSEVQNEPGFPDDTEVWTDW